MGMMVFLVRMVVIGGFFWCVWCEVDDGCFFRDFKLGGVVLGFWYWW